MDETELFEAAKADGGHPAGPRDRLGRLPVVLAFTTGGVDPRRCR
jgi:hypothetical protein